MKPIYGQGVPSKIKKAGSEYLDIQTGKRYMQTQLPFGSSWSLIGSATSSDSSYTPNNNIIPPQLLSAQTEIKTAIFNIDYNDILNNINEFNEFLVFGDINPTEDGFIQIININGDYTGTTIYFPTGLSIYILETNRYFSNFNFTEYIGVTSNDRFYEQENRVNGYRFSISNNKYDNIYYNNSVSLTLGIPTSGQLLTSEDDGIYAGTLKLYINYFVTR